MVSHAANRKKYYIETMGCQMNVHDSEILAGHLESMGYCEAAEPAEADVYILNTCAVRKKAEEKVYSKLGKLKPWAEGPKKVLTVLWGCIPQQEGAARRLKARFPFLDLISGTHCLGIFPELLQEASSSSKTILALEEGTPRENLPIKREHPFKAWVPVSYGCNNFCTYCVVPYVRGPEKSRSATAILEEVEGLSRQGYREITLLGQNVNSYGRDLCQSIRFAGLLRRLDRVPGLYLIRFMTSHPRDFSDDIIFAMAEGKKICEHIHLPLQAGSNRILESMNRGYTREEYINRVRAIRKAIPEASITTDLIVGFPGESTEDFLDTLQIVEELQFDSAFTFIYSPRQGTKAARFPNQIMPDIKKKRIMELNNLQNRISLQKNERLLGTQQTVLVEGRSKTNPQMFTGRTRTNKLVHFPTESDVVGKMIPVLIKEARPWSLQGLISKNHS